MSNHTGTLNRENPKPDTTASSLSTLHHIWDSLLQKHVSTDGVVNYKGFQADLDRLDRYLNALAEQVPQSYHSREDKLAYWINVYNAYTVKLILNHYPVKSIKDIKNPWKQHFFKLGGKSFNLDDVEHRILRKMDEPRIHFAIVCASFSCPKLQNHAFTAQDIEKQLTQATEDFLKDAQKNRFSENSAEISLIFKWFAKDFKKNGSIIDFLNQYLDTPIKENSKVSFLPYDWDLNGK
ncbi:DUF547 domain-containing protein [Ascidiimonas aurantiaca]|uniref:DUF547 domain-containing protein n=1 Tax=Ascidiimonas aurantiaca TaxID=1685432 RepID=UPI0030EB7678